MANMFGPWEPESFETEDSAFGLIKWKMAQRSSWKPLGP